MQGSSCADDMGFLRAAIPTGRNYPSSLGCSAAVHDFVVTPNEPPSLLGPDGKTFFTGWLSAKFLSACTCPSQQKCSPQENGAAFQDSGQLFRYLSVKNVGSADFGKLLVPRPAFVMFLSVCEEAFSANVKTSLRVRSKPCEVLDISVPKTLHFSSVRDDLFCFFLRVRLFWFA